MKLPMAGQAAIILPAWMRRRAKWFVPLLLQGRAMPGQ
jgi:hypothetical protein